MNVPTWLKQAKAKIPALDAELILLEALGLTDRAQISIWEGEIPAASQVKADQMLMRRSQQEPLAYILGHKEFCGREFEVSREVLIPRPESEALIELALQLPLQKVLDVGTGSGCLAISLLLASEGQIEVLGVDNSQSALAVARANSKKLLADKYADKISFELSDLTAQVEELVSYDLIMANLPYVDEKWDFLDQKTLAYEPRQALFADEGGLAVIKRLVGQLRGRDYHGYLLLEADPCQYEALQKLVAGRVMAREDFAYLFEI